MPIFDEAKRKTRELKEQLDRQKNGRCQDCGGTFPSYVLSFDKYNEDCIFTPEANQRTVETIAAGDLVCANCLRIRWHRRRTSQE